MKNRDLPAFPLPNEAAPFEGHSAIDGLTKREYFAAMAMQGIVANERATESNEDGEHESIAAAIASNAVFMADALLAELEK